jgi:hypothetical protein
VDEAIKVLVNTYGLPGIVIAILLVAVVWLATNLRASYQDRIAQAEKYLDATYKQQADMLEVLRNLKSSIEVSVNTMNTAMAVLKSKV